MNFQNLNFDYVEAPQSSDLTSKLHKTLSGRSNGRRSGSWSSQQPRPISEIDSHSTIRQQQRERRRSRRYRNSSSTANNSLSPQPTVVPHAPSPPSPPSQTDSVSELYGPDRLFANPSVQPVGYHAITSPEQTPVVHFDEAQLAMFAADNAARMASINIKDELALAAGKVTPGVDDTPYIQYALQALVGAHGTSPPQHLLSGTSDVASERYQLPRNIRDEEVGTRPITYPQVTPPDIANVHDQPAHLGAGVARPDLPAQPPAQQHHIPIFPQPPRSSAGTVDPTAITSSRWVPVTKDMRHSLDPQSRTYQPLTFKPRILRPFSMIILIILCLLMTVALIFSATYSDGHDGLTPYPGSIYSGQYFVFRILPQLLAGIIFIYAQSIVTTSLRILPFTALANEDPRERYMALFQQLYPVSFLLPQFVGPWQFKLFDVATWLAIFTIPLQSATFACIYVGDKWIWAPVQGVVWTLVALYIILLLSTAALMVYWFGQWTGLIWDIRSIGDALPLLNRSNGMASYARNDLAENSADFKAQLRERWFDRLGYWRTEDMITGGIWYTLGASSDDQDAKALPPAMGRRASDDPSVDSRDLAPVGSFDRARGKYLPWCLRDGPVLVSVAVSSLLLLALLIVSFLPQTRLESGFFAGVTAKPTRSAFSPANFVFSFVPSLIGMILFLLFQSVDQALRIHQPWADLYEVNGSLARRSLLADYAACLPLQSTWRATNNGHWRVAAVSLLAAVFVFIPILAGGLFMALTGIDGKVRMYPSMPVFGVLLAFLFLYVGGLSLMVPHRRQFLLPRPVTSIGEMISFCSAEELTQDAAFRSVRSREDLEGRLGVGRDDTREESTWFFGIVPGRDEHRLSVRRMKKFTEKRLRSRSVRSMV
ncbi:hypothetical protein PT974_09370 [Cladobotryum mycophilum]|uniref:Phosphoribosylaminoimidazole-succinocarboxamide synthase n=1 Tax=Cladobotryum mycophilum TaxID=491253 RepID=A0ABR0SFZ3_9HYPO